MPHTKLYDILGVTTTASKSEVKKAYHKKSKEVHPDKHPDDPEANNKFQEVQKAYEILVDDDKRANYDRYGEDGPQMPDINMDDVFGGGFFSSMFRTPKPSGPCKGNQMIYELGITLKQFYNGVTKKLKINRRRTCNTCEGSGLSLDGNAAPCYECHGKGIKVERIRAGPGVVHQRHISCDKCAGEGETISKDNSCSTCSGKKTVTDPNIIEVNIIPGMSEGMALKYENQGDELPNTIPGDLIVSLKEKPDPDCSYIRYNVNDLIYTHKITLLDSLRGWTKKLTLLDDSVITVKSPKGVYTPHGTMLSVPSKGMPIIHTSNRGRLIISIVVGYPESGQIDLEQMKELAKILPSSNDELSDEYQIEMLEATIIS